MTTFTLTSGIVLTSRDWREVDRLYTVFTKDLGKVELLGRGARKPLAKLAPHLEFVGEADFFVVHGKVFDTLAGVERRQAFPGIYFHAEKMMLAHQALVLFDLGTAMKEVDQDMYAFLHNWLVSLDADEHIPSSPRCGFLLSSFALKLLTLMGHEPQLIDCLSCERRLEPERLFFHALKGGMVCLSCRTSSSEDWFAAREIDIETLKLLRFSLSEPFSRLFYLQLPEPLLSQFHDFIESFLLAHFPIVPPVLLRQVVGM